MNYPKISGKRVLVTGGAGFIGSHLCRSLVENDNTVVCFDNFSTASRSNIEPLLNNPHFQLLEGDIRNAAACLQAADGVDVILHQAALGSVPRSVKDPVTTNDVNLNGFLNILVAAKQRSVSRIVYATSSSVYGNSKFLPKVEHTIGEPLSPYAVTKRGNELYADVFARNYGMKITGLRYFNVFGPLQDPHGEYAAAIPRFTMKLMKHESPLIHGDGTSSRDFTYVENIVQLNHLAATSEVAAGEIFNGAAGDSADLNTLIALLRENLRNYDPEIDHVKVTYGPVRQGDIQHSLASIEKARTLLGYQPTHDFRKGLKEAVKWYWENLR
jgi:UDP-N-acetylglucosamine/UDP-N-acetylgalactosamine 4-epimerase